MDPVEAWLIGRSLLDSHGLEDWSFDFDNAKMRFGHCRHDDKAITVSGHMVMLNGEADFRDIVLHEVAHALVGYEAAHGPEWRAKCVEVGAKPQVCGDVHLKRPAPTYVAYCPSCLKRYHCYRLPRAGSDRACGVCCNGTYDERFKLTWKRRQH